MNKTLTEFEEALLKADKSLDEPYADPDDDLRTISRQFLRLNERYTQAKKEGAREERKKHLLEIEKLGYWISGCANKDMTCKELVEEILTLLSPNPLLNSEK